MLFREHLKEYTKEELIVVARSFGLKNYSKLRKAKLIDAVTEAFCSEDMLRARLACLTDKQLAIFRKACSEPQEILVDDATDAMRMCIQELGDFEEITDYFTVYEEVAKAFSAIDDDDFKEDQRKKGWLIKCTDFFANYYGMAPLEIIYKLFHSKVKGTLEEMMDLLLEMPIDAVGAILLSMESLGMQDWPVSDPIYSDYGILVKLEMLEDEEFDNLLEQQMDKDFYIPSAIQIEEMYTYGYEKSSLAYQRLHTFFRKKIGMPPEQAEILCLQVWANSYEGESPTEIMHMLSEDVVFDSEKQIEEFVDLLMKAHNETRLRENRGHKPNELAGSVFSNEIPTIAPAIRSENKVYPNDPCPCGSGKKYKKCCGRK